ncbi:MAG: hypothetical protein R3C16_04690 [Hyphomonadaceae bacterium]
MAEAFLATLYMLFGAPETVAAQHTLTARARGAGGLAALRGGDAAAADRD